MQLTPNTWSWGFRTLINIRTRLPRYIQITCCPFVQTKQSMVYKGIRSWNNHQQVNNSSRTRWNSDGLYALTRRIYDVAVTVHISKVTSNNVKGAGQVWSRIPKKKSGHFLSYEP